MNDDNLAALRPMVTSGRVTVSQQDGIHILLGRLGETGKVFEKPPSFKV